MPRRRFRLSRVEAAWARWTGLIRCRDRDKGKELIFHRDAVARARSILAPQLVGAEGLTVSEIAEALGLSRKFVMPLLDHFHPRSHLGPASPEQYYPRLVRYNVMSFLS